MTDNNSAPWTVDVAAGGNAMAQMADPSQEVDLSVHGSGLVPTLQNVVSTVNLGCKLDLKTIALQVPPQQHNPSTCPQLRPGKELRIQPEAVRRGHYANSRSKDHCADFLIWQNGSPARHTLHHVGFLTQYAGVHWRQKRGHVTRCSPQVRSALKSFVS